jgi:hypothetical protein
MICETKTTKGSAKSMNYQANDKGFAVEVGRNGLIGDEPKEWHKQMRAIESQYNRANFENKRVTQVISLTKEEAKEMKSAKDWEDLAKKHYEKKGIDLKNHAYIMHTHGSTKNPHLHITVSRVTFDGKQGIKSQNIGEEFGKITDKIAKERGWNTAKETAEQNRKEVGRNINEVLQKEKVTDFEIFKTAMGERGYHVKLAQSESKGTYGMRIIPNDEYTETPSPRLAKSGQGYKLSEIEKAEGTKAKFKIDDIKAELNKNKITAEHKQAKGEEKIKESREERFQRADININNRVNEELKKGELMNFGNDVDPILREEIGKEFPKENVWAVIDEQGGNDYQDKIFQKIEQLSAERKNIIKNEVYQGQNKEKEKPKELEKTSETQQNYDRFDRAKANKEAKQDQERDQEKKRGFRR